MRRTVLALLLSTLLVGCSTTRQITISTRPPDANIKVDDVDRGRGQVTEKLVFNDKDSKHTVTVSRLGFKEQTATLKRDYSGDTLQIDLRPLTRRITTNPPGAQVYLDGEALGTSPVSVTARPFPVDVQTDEVVPQKLRVVKPGYDPVETTIGWEEGKTEYRIDLTAKTKVVRFITDP